MCAEQKAETPHTGLFLPSACVQSSVFVVMANNDSSFKGLSPFCWRTLGFNSLD